MVPPSTDTPRKKAVGTSMKGAKSINIVEWFQTTVLLRIFVVVPSAASRTDIKAVHGTAVLGVAQGLAGVALAEPIAEER